MHTRSHVQLKVKVEPNIVSSEITKSSLLRRVVGISIACCLLAFPRAEDIFLV